jgi:tetrahydromethanopterin S-methyltransferase subunit G
MVDSPGKKTFMETIETLAAKLETFRLSVDSQFAEVNRRFEQVDKRFEQVDKRFEQIDRQFGAVDEHFAEQRGYVEFAFTRLEKSMGTRLDRIERKLDQLTTPWCSASR